MLDHLNFFYAFFYNFKLWTYNSFQEKIIFLLVNYISLGKILLCVYFFSFGKQG